MPMMQVRRYTSIRQVPSTGIYARCYLPASQPYVITTMGTPSPRDLAASSSRSSTDDSLSMSLLRPIARPRPHHRIRAASPRSPRHDGSPVFLDSPARSSTDTGCESPRRCARSIASSDFCVRTTNAARRWRARTHPPHSSSPASPVPRWALRNRRCYL